MRLVPVAAALVLTVSASASSARAQIEGAGATAGLFDAHSVVEATIEAPVANLIANGRQNTAYAVVGKVTLTDVTTGRTTSAQNVRITTRGHTSLRESECDFPKLKLFLAHAGWDWDWEPLP